MPFACRGLRRTPLHRTLHGRGWVDTSVKGSHVDEQINLDRTPAAGDERRYEAFISYSHTESDACVAREIQRFIEGFPVPRRLRESIGRARLGKVFRDEDELAAGSSLDAGLTRALEASSWLIVVCSPAAAASPWVAREIETFIAVHGADCVLAVLASGEPAEAFPPALAAGEGVPGVSGEPIAADLRAEVVKRQRRAELLRLAAPIIGCPYDELIQRQRVRRRRRIAAMMAVAILVCAVTLSAIQSALLASGMAKAERFRQEAFEAYDEGDRIEALRLALDGVAPGSDPVQKAEAQFTLAETLGVYPGSTEPQYAYALNNISNPVSIEINQENGLFSYIDNGRVIRIYDIVTGALVQSIDCDDCGLEVGYTFARQFPIGDALLVSLYDHALACFDMETGELLWFQDDVGSVAQAIDVGDGRVVLECFFEDHMACIVADASNGTVLFERSLYGFGERPPSTVHAMTTDGATAVVTIGDRVARIDLTSGVTEYSSLSEKDPRSLTIQDGCLFALTTDLATSEGGDWSGHAAICAYSLDDLSVQWKREFSWNPYHFEESYLPYNSYAAMYDLVEIQESRALPMSCGSEVVLIDAFSGEVISRASVGSTIVALQLYPRDGVTILQIIDASGASYVGSIDSDGNVNLVTNGSLDLARPVFGAKLYCAGDECYSIGYDVEDMTTVLVSRQGALPDNPGIERLGDSGFVEAFFVTQDRSRVAVLCEGGAINILDGETFATESVIDLNTLGISETRGGRKIAFSEESSDLLLLMDEGGEDSAPIIRQIDVTSGLITRTWLFPLESEGADYSAFEFTIERNGYITLRHPSGYLALIDASTLETLEQFNVESMRIIDMVVLEDNTYFALFADGSACQCYIGDDYSEVIGDGFSSGVFSTSTGDAHIAVSPDGETYAFATAVGTVGVIDIASGNILWSVEVPTLGNDYIGYSYDGDILFVQNSNNELICFSADTGKRLASTDEVNGEVYACDTLNDGCGIYVQSATSKRHTQLFSLSDDTLTLTAEIEGGRVLSQQGDSVIMSSTLMYYRQPIYTLEELEEMAREEIAAYEGR